MPESRQLNERRNMKEKQIKLPGPDHPISIQRNPARVVVSVAGRVVADTSNALTLREAKGDCNYYSIPVGGKKSVNAVWSYEDPFPAVAEIRAHVAFYPDRVDEIAEQRPTTRDSSKSGLPMFGEKFGRSPQTNPKPTKERNIETKTDVAPTHGASPDGATNHT